MSCNDFLFFWCLFLQNEEKSQSEVSVSPPTALLSSLIFCVQSLDLLEHGVVFTVVSSYMCNCIVTDPVTGSCSSLNTCVHLNVLLYACALFHLLIWTYQRSNLGASLICCYCTFFSIVCLDACVCVWYWMLLWNSYVCFCRGAFWCRAFLRPQIRKLRRELDASQEKVSALTTQLSANVSEALKHTLLNKLIWTCNTSFKILITYMAHFVPFDSKRLQICPKNLFFFKSLNQRQTSIQLW